MTLLRCSCAHSFFGAFSLSSYTTNLPASNAPLVSLIEQIGDSQESRALLSNMYVRKDQSESGLSNVSPSPSETYSESTLARYGPYYCTRASNQAQRPLPCLPHHHLVFFFKPPRALHYRVPLGYLGHTGRAHLQ